MSFIGDDEETLDVSIDREAFMLPTREDISRDLHSAAWVLTSFLAIALSVLVVHHAWFRETTRGQHTILAVGLGLAVSGAVHLLEKDEYESRLSKTDYIITLLGMIAAIAICAYIFTIREDLAQRLFRYNRNEYILAGIMVVTVVLWIKRAAGRVFFLVVLALIFYAYFGPQFPGALNHRGMTVTRLLERSVLVVDEGIFGRINRIGSTWIAIFIIYAGLMQGYGATDLFTSYTVKYANSFKSGVPQSAVFTSFAVGSILGAGSANTAITGSFTIPMMKTVGIRGKVAAAIEAVGSSGGQIMPPVMGTAAFIIASFLGIDYVEVLIASFLPAVLFFLVISFSVYLIWSKSGLESDLKGHTDMMQTDFDIETVDAIPFVLSFIVLLYYLVWLEFPILTAAIYSIAVLVGSQFIFHLLYYDNRVEKFKENVRRTLEGLQIGGINTALILVIIAAIEIMVIIVNVSGITQEINFFLLDLSGDSLFLILLAGAVLSLVFGLGMPVVAAYVLVAIFVAPLLTEFGVPQLHSHLFVLYFAVLSSITPPVAVCCVVASAIADSDFMDTCLEAVKLGTPLYILPFAFISYPRLLAPELMSIPSFFMVAVGLMCLAVAVYGYMDHEVHTVFRLLFLVLGLAIIANLYYTVTLGIVAFAFILLLLSLTRVGRIVPGGQIAYR